MVWDFLFYHFLVDSSFLPFPGWGCFAYGEDYFEVFVFGLHLFEFFSEDDVLFGSVSVEEDDVCCEFLVGAVSEDAS